MATEALNKQQLRDLKEVLLGRQRLLKSVTEQELHVDNEDEVRGTASTDADWATADVEANAALSRLERDQNELNAIERALDRIESNEYGICESCGGTIGYPRLLVHPTATRCLACQQRREADSNTAHAR